MNHLPIALAATALSCSAFAQVPPPVVFSRTAPRAEYIETTGVTGPAPANRHWTQTAHNGTSMFVFGGRSGTGAGPLLNDLWEFDAAALTWTQHTADGAAGSPPARFRAAVSWNANTGCLVVFGGEDASGTVLDDTWEWERTTNTWNQISPVSVPPARRFSSLAEAPGIGVLMFGGVDSSGADLDDTWLYIGRTWNQILPNTVPGARGHHHLVTRSDFGDVLLCGGQTVDATGRIHYLDTWRWNPTSFQWNEIVPTTPAVPAAVFGNAAAYDPIRQCVVLTGGNGISNASAATGGAYGTLYGGSPTSWTSEFDCVNNEWRLYGPMSNATADPVIGRASRYFTAFLIDRVWLWGGQDPTGTANLTAMKEYQTSAFPAVTALGGGCAGLSLNVQNEPWLGRTFETTVRGVAANGLVWGVTGFTLQTVPLIALDPAGIPGCDALTDVFGAEFLGGGADLPWNIPLPNVVALAGAQMNMQALQIQLDITGTSITALGASDGIVLTAGAL